jgi:DNA primase
VRRKDLREGCRLAHSYPTTFRSRQGRKGRIQISPFGIARGLVFGDGTVAGRGSVAYLCGDKDAQLLKWFPLNEVYRESERVIVSGLPAYFKTDLPPLDDSTGYLYGWLAGYFAADGCVDKDGSVYIASSCRANLQFVRDLCTRIGVGTFGVRSYPRNVELDEARWHPRLWKSDVPADPHAE